jgi:hypothetical protein
MHLPNPPAAERYRRIQQLCTQLRQLVSSSAEQRGALDQLLEEALRVADEISRELDRRARAAEQKVSERSVERTLLDSVSSPQSSREQLISRLWPLHDGTDRSRSNSGAVSARRDLSCVVDARTNGPSHTQID